VKSWLYQAAEIDEGHITEAQNILPRILHFFQKKGGSIERFLVGELLHMCLKIAY
jgi:hypothetical protein